MQCVLTSWLGNVAQDAYRTAIVVYAMTRHETAMLDTLGAACPASQSKNGHRFGCTGCIFTARDRREPFSQGQP